eukprot:1156954-Prorocentrum_minimum.AAC.2
MNLRPKEGRFVGSVRGNSCTYPSSNWGNRAGLGRGGGSRRACRKRYSLVISVSIARTDCTSRAAAEGASFSTATSSSCAQHSRPVAQ